MKARLVAFGEVRLKGRRYTYDVVIEAGHVRRRDKGPSRPLRARYGHTPLTVAEDIPWGGRRLIVGCGVEGALRLAPQVYEEGARRMIPIDVLPTEAACRLLAELERQEVYAILHVTC